jgi:hypothetical protein
MASLRSGIGPQGLFFPHMRAGKSHDYPYNALAFTLTASTCRAWGNRRPDFIAFSSHSWSWGIPDRSGGRQIMHRLPKAS